VLSATRALLLAALALVACAALPGRLAPARAQQGIVVQSDAAQNEFPTGVTFSVAFTAPAATDEVRLHYEVAPDGTGATAIAQCSGTTTVSCAYTLTSGRGIYVIPGANITYSWEIRTTDGRSLQTPDRLYVHEDTRFAFRTLQRDNITLYYHAGGEAQAQQVLDAAAETLQRIGALEQTQVTFPVKVFLYQTADEMQPAIAPVTRPGSGVQILGEVVYSDTAMVSADVVPLDITRHEVAHIVTEQATKGPFGIASWMNEGISVYAQQRPLESHEQALEAAIRSDRVLSFAEMSGSSAGQTAQTVGLFYGEAGSIIKYLIDTYGDARFAQLLKVFRDGSRPDDAYQAVYGISQLELKNGWRASVGLEPRAPSATPTAAAAGRPGPATGSDVPGARASTTDTRDDALTWGIIGALAVGAVASAAVVASVVRQRM
jgi:hypothetical protein